MIADLVKSLFQWCVTRGARVLLFLFADFSVHSRENLRSLPLPLLVVANHRSFWDVLLIGMLFPWRQFPLGSIAHDVFFQNPFIRLLMWLGGGVPAHKGKGLDISLRVPHAILAKKKVFVIFPFGKMVWGGNYPVPGRGAATLIQRTPHLTILPIYLDTTPNMTPGMFLFSRCRMRIFVGEPFSIPAAHTRDTDDITQEICERIFALSSGIEYPPQLRNNVNRVSVAKRLD